MYQRVGVIAFRKDLKNTLALCKALGNPHTKFKSVHVGGTNGKGSTSHMIASVLQSAGYKTGLYTSPHLKDFTERIKVNGKEVDKEFIVDFVNRIQPFIKEIDPSFFEITVAMAFDYFARQPVDIAVIEVGLGGRLDSTNVITPVVSVITNIGLDHMDLLGNTLPEIAREKAGIIKHKIPVVISERQKEIEGLFISKATETESMIFFGPDTFNVTEDEGGLHIFRCGKEFIQNMRLPLSGNYQRKNLLGVLSAIDVLNQSGFNVQTGAIREGLEKIVQQTGLKGRWQILSDKPLIICDTGHNYDGISEVVQQILKQSFSRLFIVWGIVKEKERAEVLKILPTEAYYFFCQADIPRAFDAQLLEKEAKLAGLKGEVVRNVNDAIRAARQVAGPDDFIFIGGSTFVVAEIDNL